MLAPSAFLALAASTHDLQQSILPESVGSLDDESLPAVETRWTSLSPSQKPGAESAYIQRAWDKLIAPPITSVGLRLLDEEIRIAVAHRLGCRACEPHTCVCGKAVDARGLHGLACRRSAPRQQRHSHLNDILWRAMKPLNAIGKRPNGTTILPEAGH